MGDTGETLVISGGVVTVDAEGDGLDSNGSLTISGGTVTVFGPTGSGNGILDANGELSVTGGTLLGIGSSGMAETPGESSTQPWIAATASIASGQDVTISDADGTQLAEITARKQAQMVIYSSPELSAEGSYTIAVGGTQAATATPGQSNVSGMGGGPGGSRGGRGSQPGGQPSTDS